MRTLLIITLLTVLGTTAGHTQKKKPTRFSWSNPPTRPLAKNVTHTTFHSPSMNLDVGYCIYLPDAYTKHPEKRFPVVYHLHGGRPGNELKSAHLASFVDAAIEAGTIAPTIYVFPNGGPVSWYNYPQGKNAAGEDVFVNGLIPHIDRTYRTITSRNGRAIQGFSQGGRGTTRIMFRHPHLFVSAAPGGSGYEPEKRIQENHGAESETIRFTPGDNAWDLAKAFSENPGKPQLDILLWVGTKGFNYHYNLKFSAYLNELEIPHRMLIAKDAPHSAKTIYQKHGDHLVRFHQKNFTRWSPPADKTGGG